MPRTPNLIQCWVGHCLDLSLTPSDLFSGCRKIHRSITLEFPRLDDTLQMVDAGYASHKMRHLEKGYLHEESISVAVELWKRRLGQAKYGSVGFTTYNHFIKNDPTKKSKRASVMGPCIQSVTITYFDKKRPPEVDVFYRTTELFKKFPADLVFLRDRLLPPFELDKPRVICHFANVTIHPMYFITILPHIENDWEDELEAIKKRDRYFFDWLIKWSARYIVPENHRGIAKFAQALRVAKDAKERIRPRYMKELQDYFRANHPGYKNDYQENDDETDE